MQTARIIASTGWMILLGAFAIVAAEPVKIAVTLQDPDGVPLSGQIMVIQEQPNLIFTTHEVDKTGFFKFTSDSEGRLVLHASAVDHPSAEHVIDAGTTGTVTVNFILPLGQDVQVRVVDAEATRLKERNYESVTMNRKNPEGGFRLIRQSAPMTMDEFCCRMWLSRCPSSSMCWPPTIRRPPPNAPS